MVDKAWDGQVVGPCDPTSGIAVSSYAFLMVPHTFRGLVSVLTPQEFKLYFWLFWHTWGNRINYISVNYRDLAQQTGQSRSTTARAMRGLETRGLLVLRNSHSGIGTTVVVRLPSPTAIVQRGRLAGEPDQVKDLRKEVKERQKERTAEALRQWGYTENGLDRSDGESGQGTASAGAEVVPFLGQVPTESCPKSGPSQGKLSQKRAEVVPKTPGGWPKNGTSLKEVTREEVTREEKDPPIVPPKAKYIEQTISYNVTKEWKPWTGIRRNLVTTDKSLSFIPTVVYDVEPGVICFDTLAVSRFDLEQWNRLKQYLGNYGVTKFFVCNRT